MKTKFIIFIVLVVLIVGGVGIFVSNKPTAPSEFDSLAKALKSSGANFYGAFWCPHCQEQKAEFGTAKQYLPYVECSKTDSSQTQICIDKKVEGYPTWTFKDGIKVISAGAPTICPIAKEGVTLEGICQSSPSQFYRTWYFKDYEFSVRSTTDPKHDGDVWQFSPESQTVGKISIPLLADQIKFTLPK